MDRQKPRLTVFVLLKALPSWLCLSRSERHRIGTEALRTALGKGPVTLRHFDAEAFSGMCSDVAVFEAEDALAFHMVMESLRDTPLFAAPHFEVVQVIPAIEDGFRHYERQAGEGFPHAA